MSNLNVFNQSWNEIVFEGRNKEYGAFQLRQENPKTTLKALFYGTIVCASLISIPLISSLLTKDADPFAANGLKELPPSIIIYDGKVIPPKVEPVQPRAELEKSSAKQDKHVIPTITQNENTVTELKPIDSETPVKTGSTENPGDGQGAIAIGEGSLNGTGTTPNFNGTTAPNPGNGEGIVLNVGLEKSPEFPGGIQNFMKEVGKRYKTPDAVSEAGTLKVFVSFVVEKDGSLSNIKVTRDPGFGLGREAIRVLQSIKTKWSPGIQNGLPVRTAYNLPISVITKN